MTSEYVIFYFTLGYKIVENFILKKEKKISKGPYGQLSYYIEKNISNKLNYEIP